MSGVPRAGRDAMALAILYGCSSPKPVNQPPPAPTSEPVQLAAPRPPHRPSPTERALTLFAQLDERVRARGGSCAAFTTELAGWLAKHGDEIRDILILDLPDEAHARIDDTITEVATTVVFAASECGKSDQAIAAYDEFDALVL